MFGKKKDKDAAAPADAKENAAGSPASKPAATDKTMKASKPAKDAKTPLPNKAEKAVKPAKAEKASKPAKTEKAAKPAAAEKTPKPAKAEKALKPKKEPKAPKVKAAKRKNVLSKGGPGFVGAHIEKMIMATILLAVGYLIYAGFSAPGYSTAEVPEKLEKDAKDLLNRIKEDHWAEIAAEPDRLVEHDFATRAADARRPTDPKNYNDGVWDPKPLGVFEKRGDPTMLPAERLVVTTVSGALAVEIPIDEIEPYDDWEDAEPIRSRRSSSNNRRTGRGRGAGSDVGSGYADDSMGMMSGGLSGPGGSMTGGTAATPKRYLKSDYNLGFTLGAFGGGGFAGGRGSDVGSPFSGGMMGSAFGGGTGVPAIRDGLKDKNKDRGPKYKLGSRAILFNSITALVPHRKMVEDYLAEFQESGNFVAMRDLPFYLSFQLQRVDVTADPNREIQENEWKQVSDGVEHTNYPLNQKWATRPPLGRPVPEVIDMRAADPGLTMPIPPILLRDYRHFSKHPAIGWIWDSRNTMIRRPRPTDLPQEENTTLPGVQRRGAGGMGMGMGMDMGGGMFGGGSDRGGDSYSGGGYDIMGGMGMGGSYGDDSMGMMSGGGSMVSGASGMMSGGMMSGGGMGMMSGGLSPESQPEFKMVRCYDMLNPARDYAKVYRYRIRLLMRDPNYPEDRMLPRPAPNQMKDDVWARVSKTMREDDARIEKDPKAMRTLLQTPWSEPSPPVYVDIPMETLAGNVDFDGPKAFEAEGKVFSLSIKEATGSVVATVMDGQTGARFAMKRDVRRGSVLSDKADVELIVPNTQIVKIHKDQPVDARATIADIRGGKTLAGDSRDDPLKAIGEMMILNRDGSVQITSEFDDMFLYRMYTFADEHEAADKANAAPSGPVYDPSDGGGGGKAGR